MTEKQIVINDLLINYLVSENQNQTAPSVVFLHGWKASAQTWLPVLTKLSGVNLYALDLPGFGKSEMPKKAFTVGDYAEIVRGFIERLTPSSVLPPRGGGKVGGLYLIGHSFGGRIATKFTAVRNESITKLVLVDSAGFRDDSLIRSLKLGAVKIAKPFVPARLRKKLAEVFGAGDYAESGELKQTFLNIINADLTEDMKKINVPTLILWGERDKDTPLAFGRRMHALIRDSRFEILPQAGHYSFLDKTEEFVKILNNFISPPREEGQGRSW